MPGSLAARILSINASAASGVIHRVEDRTNDHRLPGLAGQRLVPE